MTGAQARPTANYVASLIGPKGCEITGVTMTPDYKAIFINVQHPGEDSKSFDAPSSHWPATQTDMNNKTARPRSATVVITRKDGKAIAGITSKA